jgi:hypothetical protein
MSKSAFAIVAGLSLILLGSGPTSAQTTVVTTTAKAGAVDGTTENSDAFIWRLFVEQIVAPVLPSRPSPVKFETWASDADTFSTTPHWPGPDEPTHLHASVLQLIKKLPESGPMLLTRLHAGTIDVKCAAPGNAAVGGFPSSGTPTPCIAEETKRDRSQFDYIVSNNLNTQAGLAAAFAKSLNVQMPTTAIAVKGDWVPLVTLLQWIPQLGSIDNIKSLYYTTTADAVEYALVSLHVSSRQNPNWVWGTYEHQMNPGRCDSIGCFDSFGAEIPAVLPDKSAVNTEYGACAKTPRLKLLKERQSLAGLGELLPEVDRGGLYRRRRDTLRAWQFRH